jgi:predicted metallopeptidase
MATTKIRSTTEQRRDKVFETYLDVLMEELIQNPSKAKAISKAWMYGKVGELTGYNPSYVGWLVQIKLKASDSQDRIKLAFSVAGVDIPDPLVEQ